MTARSRKIALIVASIFVLLILLVVIAVPLLVDVDRYRPEAAAEIESKTGKRARIGHLALTLFPRLSIRVDDFELDNPRGFPQGYFLRAQRIYAIVDARALLDRQVRITSLELEQPDIRMISDAHGHWNYENPPEKTRSSGASEAAPAFTLGVISKVNIDHGEWTMANLLPSAKTGPAYLEASDISSELDDVDLSVFGRPETSWMHRPLIPAGGDGGGWLAPVAYAAVPSEPLAAHGWLDAASLRFDTLRGTSVKTKVRILAWRILLDDIGLDLDGGHAQGALALDFSGPNLRYVTSVTLHGVDMARLLESFPQSRGKMTGTMDGNLKLNGEVSHSADPLSGMKGVGQATVRNGKLPSLQLNKNLMLLARLATLGPAAGDPSSFSSMAADFEIAQDRIRSHNVTIVGNGVDVNGTGSMALQGPGALDYTGIAKLAAGETGLTAMLANFSGATYAGGKLSFPFDLKGTLENPRFILKSVGAAQSLGGLQNMLGQPQTGSSSQNPGNLIQGITGLFGKKKQTQPPQ